MFDEEKDRYIPLFEGAGHKRQTKTERIRMEMKMEYHTLKNTASSCIHKTFMAAFSDYQVSVAMPLEAFERMLKRNGFMPDVSVGAFSDGVLVGFVLNGVRECNGVKTIYDLGTGVIPAFRRTGITDRLLNLVKAICIENQIGVYQLEVIQNNESAVALYQKQGFQVRRALNCYHLEGKGIETGQHTKWTLSHPHKLEEGQWTAVKRFWKYPPSWQNETDAVCAIADSFFYTLAELDGELAGYGIADKKNGDIVQLAVNPMYCRMGAATEILRDLRRQTKSSGMRMLNVDERDPTLNGFLKKTGFNVFVKQYEMVKYM